jgi:hypothetical protein
MVLTFKGMSLAETAVKLNKRREKPSAARRN